MYTRMGENPKSVSRLSHGVRAQARNDLETRIKAECGSRRENRLRTSRHLAKRRIGRPAFYRRAVWDARGVRRGV